MLYVRLRRALPATWEQSAMSLWLRAVGRRLPQQGSASLAAKPAGRTDVCMVATAGHKEDHLALLEHRCDNRDCGKG